MIFVLFCVFLVLVNVVEVLCVHSIFYVRYGGCRDNIYDDRARPQKESRFVLGRGVRNEIGSPRFFEVLYPPDTAWHGIDHTDCLLLSTSIQSAVMILYIDRAIRCDV